MDAGVLRGALFGVQKVPALSLGGEGRKDEDGDIPNYFARERGRRS